MLETDEELMRRAREGDGRAFSTLFERHLRAVFRFQLRFAGRTAAEDASQETFVRAWHYRSSYRPGSRFLPWLFAIARNAGNEARRVSSKTVSVPGPLVQPDVVCASREIEALATRSAVEAALLALPDDQRLCVILREYEQYTYEEIGDALGCSAGAARVLGFRARVRLRKLLGDAFHACEAEVAHA
jgi:RNA polymerase sigma-70 factor (ECF subfamily)